MVAQAEGIKVQDGGVERVDGRYLLHARLDFHLNPDVLEALESGVPLVFDLHLKILRKGVWFWASPVWERHLRFQIRYRALSDIYQVVGLDTGRLGNYATRNAALAALGDIRGVELPTTLHLSPNATYEVALHMELDRESLPLPLRLIAYLTPAWHVSNGWSQWPLPK